MKSEIILYRPDELAEHVEVRIEDETVWLSQHQMATLFNQTKQNISLHINNCYKEGELEREATVKESLTVQKEGGREVKRKIEYYIDETTLILLSKKRKEVKVILLTKNISKQLALDVQKANEQYGNFKVALFTKSHDRFLIVDSEDIYFIGASLKDLGKKWFAFSKMEKNSVESITNEIMKYK